ncbi:MAG TPA: hypothetical protein PLL20_17145 [Phycisphaerae bacterium]|nr:hypothetical protein [Phycisphaerae bacterium]HRR85615.1 hypothetical protein [Phycisphaerae bacterium]
MLADYEVHPAGQCVPALGDADHLDAAVLKLRDDRAGFGEVAAEPVELVDQHPFDLAGFGVGQQPEQGFTAGHRAAGAGPVNVFAVCLGLEVAAAGVELDFNRRAAILGVGRVARVDCRLLHGPVSWALRMSTARRAMTRTNQLRALRICRRLGWKSSRGPST